MTLQPAAAAAALMCWYFFEQSSGRHTHAPDPFNVQLTMPLGTAKRLDLSWSPSSLEKLALLIDTTCALLILTPTQTTKGGVHGARKSTTHTHTGWLSLEVGLVGALPGLREDVYAYFRTSSDENAVVVIRLWANSVFGLNTTRLVCLGRTTTAVY